MSKLWLLLFLTLEVNAFEIGECIRPKSNEFNHFGDMKIIEKGDFSFKVLKYLPLFKIDGTTIVDSSNVTEGNLLFSDKENYFKVKCEGLLK